MAHAGQEVAQLSYAAATLVMMMLAANAQMMLAATVQGTGHMTAVPQCRTFLPVSVHLCFAAALTVPCSEDLGHVAAHQRGVYSILLYS